MKLIAISGRSGAGKTVALHVLEDLGYKCIDSVPFQLLDNLLSTLDLKNDKIVISLDMRNLPDDPIEIETLYKSLEEKYFINMIYLDADNGELIRRFSETRRLHPLSKQKLSLSQALDLEDKLLVCLKENAQLSIDTTSLSVHNLSEQLKMYLQGSSKNELLVIFKSFGFKYEHPGDADYIFDVRFLPNPHWDPKLRKFTGLDSNVQTFLKKHEIVEKTISQIEDLFKSWLPELENNNRNYVTIAIGCTGGKHRSVFVAEQLASRFKKSYHVQIEHICIKNE